MSRHIDFTRGAGSDFRQAFDWYESQEPGLGRDFLMHVDHVTAAIVDRPYSFPVRHQGFHRALVRKFPYTVYFRVNEDKIVVTAIVHGARDPEQVLRLLHRKY